MVQAPLGHGWSSHTHVAQACCMHTWRQRVSTGSEGADHPEDGVTLLSLRQAKASLRATGGEHLPADLAPGEPCAQGAASGEDSSLPAMLWASLHRAVMPRDC